LPKGNSTLDAFSAVSNIPKTALSGDRWLGGRKEYCAIVTLDVKNAFNTARWPIILAAMNRMGIPEYLSLAVFLGTGSYGTIRILSFKEHASYASKKAAVTASSLARLMPNVGCPRHLATKVLVSVAKASLLYAAPIWSNATCRGSYLKGAHSVLRSMALRLIRGFSHSDHIRRRGASAGRPAAN